MNTHQLIAMKKAIGTAKNIRVLSGMDGITILKGKKPVFSADTFDEALGWAEERFSRGRSPRRT